MLRSDAPKAAAQHPTGHLRWRVAARRGRAGEDHRCVLGGRCHLRSFPVMVDAHSAGHLGRCDVDMTGGSPCNHRRPTFAWVPLGRYGSWTDIGDPSSRQAAMSSANRFKSPVSKRTNVSYRSCTYSPPWASARASSIGMFSPFGPRVVQGFSVPALLKTAWCGFEA